MKIPIKYLIAVIFGLTIEAAHSGVADLELTMSFDIPEYVNFGDTGEFSITITNHGPDDAGATSGSSYPIIGKTSIVESSLNGGARIAFSDQSSPHECFFITLIGDPIPGYLPIYRFDFNYPVIPAGSSVTCYGYYFVNIDRGQETITWDIRNPTDTDPNLDNNSVDMIFGIRPEPVPSLSAWSKILMTLLMLVVAGVSLRFKNNYL